LSLFLCVSLIGRVSDHGLQPFVKAAREIVEHMLRRALLPYGDTADDGVRFCIVVKQEGKFGFGHIKRPTLLQI